VYFVRCTARASVNNKQKGKFMIAEKLKWPLNYSLPISPSYRTPIFEAVGLQVVLGILSLLILDGGTTARICGIALVAFWGATALLVLRRPQLPTKIDILWIRFGYLPIVVLAWFMVHFIWHVRGVE
jgi:hypothetical protein